jgi:hypothetical protein
VKRIAAMRISPALAVAALALLSAAATASADSAPSIESESVSHITVTDATVEAQIDPGGLETEYQFRVVADPCHASPLNCELVTDPLFPSPPGVIAPASGSQSVSLDLKSAGLTLESGREYHYAVFATNSEGTEGGTDQTFKTDVPPSVESESVSNVTPTDATLEAEINLHEAPAGVYYQFQLVSDPSEYASELLCPPTLQPGFSGCVGPQASGALPIGFLPGNTLQPSATLHASLDLAGAGVILQPGTIYHYRVLAARAVQTEDTIEWEGPTVYGADQTFTTPSAGTAPSIPVGSLRTPSKHSHTRPPRSHRCVPHSVGYNAVGALISAALTAGPHGRFSGTLEVNVAKGNHHAPTGVQTLTLTGARVKFHHGVDPTVPAPGSRVKLHGKITKLSKHCPAEGFTPRITVKKVDIRRVKH